MTTIHRIARVGRVSVSAVVLAVVSTGCTPSPDDASDPTTANPTLKDAFADDFLIGAALNGGQVTGAAPAEAALVAEQFNAITAENAMKWEEIHPEPGRYDFEIADSMVAFAERHGMAVIGHTLVWHNQVPDWVFEDEAGNPVGRDTLLARMRDHIHAVVGRYRGRIHGWDVVNEALNEDGSLRDSPWRRIIGDDYVAQAFTYAHEADPDAELYYNDYSLPNAPKRNGAVTLIRSLQEEGVPVTGIGLQGHYNLSWPTLGRLDSSIVAFTGLGINVMITELDIDVLPAVRQGAEITDTAAWQSQIDPYTEALPDSIAHTQADRYASLFDLFLRHRNVITRVTFWGVNDGNSWKNYWPAAGRTNYPLLFDRDNQPKTAFEAVIDAARR